MKWKIILMDEVDSTNVYLLDKVNNGNNIAGFAVCAFKQTHGRGQRGTVWSSEPGKNLTFSTGLPVNFLPVERQFALSRACALAVRDFIVNITGGDIQVKIKWPNDIYASGKKIAGILIENIISGKAMEASVAGFGININQSVFGMEAPVATSVKLLTGKSFNITHCLDKMLEYIEFWYSFIEKLKFSRLQSEYESSLYRLNEPAEYLFNGEKLKLTVTGTSETGELRLQDEKGIEIMASMKELVYL